MRWSIVRVIWMRELRDQLRDRRTIFMIVLLPVLIYPLGGMALMQLASGFLNKPRTIGICGIENLPAGAVRSSEVPPALAVASLPLVPFTATGAGDVASLTSALAATQFDRLAPPLLVLDEPTRGRFSPNIFDDPRDAGTLLLRVDTPRPQNSFTLERVDRTLLDNRDVDLLIVIPPNFGTRLEEEGRPTIHLLGRAGDDRSRLANGRVMGVLARWDVQLKEARFIRRGLPVDFDHPIAVHDPEKDLPSAKRAADDLYALLIKIFPFVLVLWSLAGALYPAIDLCAGEKERGTMETLLITPASREEIVWGKFLAIWVFSAATALLNLGSMAVTTWQLSTHLVYSPFRPMSFVWCIVLLLPLAAFFSALCLAIGAYARSTKEGQYYLMPLFLVTLPLSLLTMAPGVHLNAFYSMVPITGVGLLLQKLLVTGTPDSSLALYFVTVLGPMIIYSWLALRWAIDQFNREEVLFREAERLEIGLWFRRLLREKEARPSAGQALFCFAVMLLLRWLTQGMGESLLVTSLISTLAFVAAPALIMATTLTTQPKQSLAVRMPPVWAWGVALALGVLLLPPLLELIQLSMQNSPALREMLEDNPQLKEWSETLRQQGSASLDRRLFALFVFAWLPAICEEVAFRGFILTGLQRRYRPRTAVLLSSFLFALLHMNVFRFIPMFLFGMVLAYLTTRCGSIFPSILLHALHNTLLLTQSIFPDAPTLFALPETTQWVIAAVTAVPGVGLLWWLTRLQPHPEYVAFLQSDPGLRPYDETTPAQPAQEAAS